MDLGEALEAGISGLVNIFKSRQMRVVVCLI